MKNFLLLFAVLFSSSTFSQKKIDPHQLTFIDSATEKKDFFLFCHYCDSSGTFFVDNGQDIKKLCLSRGEILSLFDLYSVYVGYYQLEGNKIKFFKDHELKKASRRN